MKRDLRPSFSGEFFSRMIANAMMPNSAIMAMKSWAKPRIGQVPIIGMWKCGLNSAPYASR